MVNFINRKCGWSDAFVARCSVQYQIVKFIEQLRKLFSNKRNTKLFNSSFMAS